MRVIVIALVLVMLLASTTTAFDREVVIGADGRVDINSVVFNRHVWTGYDVYGDGIVNVIGTFSVGMDNLDTAYDIEMGASPKTLTPIRAITATAGRGDVTQEYGLMVAPKAGEVGRLSVHYEHSAPMPDFGIDIPQAGAPVMAFSQLAITANAQVSNGELRTHINIYSPEIQTGLRESVRIQGEAYYQDRLSFDKLGEVQINMPE